MSNNLSEMMKKNRFNELKAVFRFIDTASVDEVAQIVAEIRVCHDNILAFNAENKSLRKVESVSVNGDCVQLNLEIAE